MNDHQLKKPHAGKTGWYARQGMGSRVRPGFGTDYL